MEEAVALINGVAETEASGGITEKTVLRRNRYKDHENMIGQVVID